MYTAHHVHNPVKAKARNSKWQATSSPLSSSKSLSRKENHPHTISPTKISSYNMSEDSIDDMLLVSLDCIMDDIPSPTSSNDSFIQAHDDHLCCGDSSPLADEVLQVRRFPLRDITPRPVIVEDVRKSSGRVKYQLQHRR